MPDKIRQNLLDIKEASEKIIQFTGNISGADKFYNEVMIFDAVMMNIIVIGEAVSRIPDDFIENYNFVDWPKIKGLRNIIAHDYFGIDAEEIWQIVRIKIPALKGDIEKIIKERWNE